MKNLGIDASKYQGTIDWAKAKAVGVKFAMPIVNKYTAV